MDLSFTLEDIFKMERRFRANLINAISGIKSANLIGTVNADGLTNLAVFNSTMHIGANPPLMSIIIRPTTAQRHTYENIKSTGYFTINAVDEALIERAHRTSGKFDKEVSEFIMCDIKPTFSNLLPSPYVAESSIQIGLKVAEEHHIKANQTIMLIGKIIEIRLPNGGVENDGQLNLKKLNLVGINGLNQYCSVKQVKSLPFVSTASLRQ